MLNHLRQHVHELLASAVTATLSTSGPAGIQGQPFPCETLDLRLYLLLPTNSDHLVNLEFNPTAVASTAHWVLRGEGHLLPLTAAPPGLSLARIPAAAGCLLVAIHPAQLQIVQESGWGFRETIDMDRDL